MASNGLGAITISLGLDAAEFTRGLTKAEYDTKKLAESIGAGISNAVNLAVSSLAALGAAGAAAFTVMNQQAEAIAGYQDLADKIGDTASQVSSLRLAADLSGVALETIAGASVKLTSALAKTDDESKGAAAAIAALGINFADFAQQSPVDQMEAVAKAFGEFEDGAGKTATAVALFGKSGADLIPFLNDLEEAGRRINNLTPEQIQLTDEYTKAQARLRSEFQSFVEQQTAKTIPIMTQVQEVLAQIAKDEATVEVATGLLKASITAAVVVFQTISVIGLEVGFVFLTIGRNIAGAAAQLVALKNFDMTGFHAIGDAVEEDSKRARQELDKTIAKIMSIDNQYKDTQLFGSDMPAGRESKKTLTAPRSSASSATAKSPKATVARLKEEEGAMDDAIKRFRKLEGERYVEAEKAAEKLIETNQKAADSYRDMLDPSREVFREMEKIKGLTEGGYLTFGEGAALQLQEMSKTSKQAKEATNEMDEYAKSAAQNIQSSFADFLFDPLEGGFKGMISGFANALRRMVAEAAAANLAKALMGSTAGGSGEGLLGGLLKTGLSIFGGGAAGAYNSGGLNVSSFSEGISSFAIGTDFVPKDQIAKIHRGERILTASENRTFDGNKGASIVYSPTIQIDSRSDRQAVMADTQRAVRQGNAELVDQLTRAGKL
jgi:hypothetical protein